MAAGLLDEIPDLAPFMGLQDRAVRCVPTASRRWLVLGLIVAHAVWIAVAVAIVFNRPAVLISDTWAVPWTIFWVGVAGLCTVGVCRRRIPFVLLLAAMMTWPAFTHPGYGWAWLVYGWLAGGVILPICSARLSPRLMSVRQAVSCDVWGVDGSPDAELLELLTVIPGVRIVHGSIWARHLVLLDHLVVFIDPDWQLQSPAGCDTQVWDGPLAASPRTALEGIAARLLAESDPWRVDRRLLTSLVRSSPA